MDLKGIVIDNKLDINREVEIAIASPMASPTASEFIDKEDALALIKHLMLVFDLICNDFEEEK